MHRPGTSKKKWSAFQASLFSPHQPHGGRVFVSDFEGGINHEGADAPAGQRGLKMAVSAPYPCIFSRD